ncbi:MAG: cell division protein FtsL [Pseudomonadota bacterium]
MRRLGFWFSALLFIAVTISAIAVVYTKFLTRKNFVELQGLLGERDQIDDQWGRLRLEQSALATHARIEETARARLEMHLAVGHEVRILRP